MVGWSVGFNTNLHIRKYVAAPTLINLSIKVVSVSRGSRTEHQKKAGTYHSLPEDSSHITIGRPPGKYEGNQPTKWISSKVGRRP